MRKVDSYDAFISYRHLAPDDDVAKELYVFLVTFELPRMLYKRSDLHKRNISPVFIDEHYTETGESLEPSVTEALRLSNTLILVCSGKTLEKNEHGVCWQKLEYDTYIQEHEDYIKYNRIAPLKLEADCDSLWLSEILRKRIYADYCKERKKAFYHIAARILKIPADDLIKAASVEKNVSAILKIIRKIIVFLLVAVAYLWTLCTIKNLSFKEVSKLTTAGIYPDCFCSYKNSISEVIESDSHEVLKAWEELCQKEIYKSDLKAEDGSTQSSFDFACSKRKLQSAIYILRQSDKSTESDILKQIYEPRTNDASSQEEDFYNAFVDLIIKECEKEGCKKEGRWSELICRLIDENIDKPNETLFSIISTSETVLKKYEECAPRSILACLSDKWPSADTKEKIKITNMALAYITRKVENEHHNNSLSSRRLNYMLMQWMSDSSNEKMSHLLSSLLHKELESTASDFNLDTLKECSILMFACSMGDTELIKKVKDKFKPSDIEKMKMYVERIDNYGKTFVGHILDCKDKNVQYEMLKQLQYGEKKDYWIKQFEMVHSSGNSDAYNRLISAFKEDEKKLSKDIELVLKAKNLATYN